MLFVLGFLSMFVLGGLSGSTWRRSRSTSHGADSYFTVAHIHYVLFGGSVFTIFAGIYYWFPKMTGRMYDERLGKLHFWLTFVGFNAMFFPMHWVGLQGMPRRVADYADGFADLNLFISLSSFCSVPRRSCSSTTWSELDARADRAVEPVAGADARVAGLSPPPIFNFDEIPPVVGTPYEYGVPGARHAV